MVRTDDRKALVALNIIQLLPGMLHKSRVVVSIDYCKLQSKGVVRVREQADSQTNSFCVLIAIRWISKYLFFDIIGTGVAV